MSDNVQITIIGTGFIGSSIGLAIKAADADITVVGHDKNPETAGLARHKQAVDKVDWNLLNACEGADMVVLAIPLSEVEETLRLIAPVLADGCVVTDTASLKQPVMEWAQALLPETVNYVGGNPMIQNETGGPEEARADAFTGGIYCITPAPGTHPDAVGLVSSLVNLMGAQPYYLDPAEHDGLMAGASHLPLALALALVSGVTREPGWREVRKFAGSNFDTLSGLLVETPEAVSQTLLANRENVMRWIDAYIKQLQEVRQLVVDDNADELAARSRQAVEERLQWLKDRRRNFSDMPEAPKIERPSLWRQILPGKVFKRRS